MKNYLRNFLILALGLITTFSFAQDWNVDSRTRVDMSEVNGADYMSTDQRATIGATWGGSNWGIHVSSDVNYTLGENSVGSMGIYEAYASMDIMGYANMTLGQQSLEYGSGNIMGSNDWSDSRNTSQGAVFNINNDMMGLDLGLTQWNDGNGGSADNMFVNASKSDGDWGVNLLYVRENSNDGEDQDWMGIDLTYSMMGGQLTLGASYNTSNTQQDDGSGNMVATESDYNSLSAAYAVNDNMSVSASMTSYGENGWNGTGNGNMDGDWDSHGNMGHLGANDENMSFGVSYDMGGISLGAAMHKITNDVEDANGVTPEDREVSEVSLGYSINDNAAVSLRYASDNDDNYMWLTVTVTP